MLSSEGPRATHGHAGDPLEISRREDVVVLTLNGDLDDGVGARLCEAAASAVAGEAARLDIDLRGVRRYTQGGARALVACRALTTALAGGLHYRTGRGPGREALLAAYRPPG